jgi:RNA polymerase sigma factor (sigma-70 family)
MMTINEQNQGINLWIQFLNGDEAAFSKLYCLFFDDLLMYGCRVGGDNEMVEDLIQDLFLKLYQRTIILEDNTKLRPFLYRSLKNMIYNQLLRLAKTQSLSDCEFTFDLEYIVDETSSLSNNNELSDEIANILKDLTERQKEVIYLRFVQDMTYDEISNVMDVNIQSARNLVMRSMEKLRKGTRPFLFSFLP